MKNDLGNLHQSEMNKLNILSEKTYTSKVGKEMYKQSVLQVQSCFVLFCFLLIRPIVVVVFAVFVAVTQGCH